MQLWLLCLEKAEKDVKSSACHLTGFAVSAQACVIFGAPKTASACLNSCRNKTKNLLFLFLRNWTSELFLPFHFWLWILHSLLLSEF